MMAYPCKLTYEMKPLKAETKRRGLRILQGPRLIICYARRTLKSNCGSQGEAVLGPMVVDFPTLIITQGVGDSAAVMAAIHRHVMLKTILANVLEQRL